MHSKDSTRAGTGGGCIALAVAAALFAGDALAQLEEIVVTAQRRAESLQDVPLAVSSLDSSAMARAGITDISRLELSVPGFTFGISSSDARPAVRGTRTEDVSNRADPPTAFYADDVYQPRASSALLPFVDVERVEVLRGPQGTLFGRNSFGGAVRVFSAAPTDQFDAGADIQIGNYEHIKTSGFINLPVNEQFQLRLAGVRERRDGYVENIFIDNDSMMDENQDFVRLSARFIPSDDVDIVLRAHHWRQRGSGSGAFGYFNAGTQRDPITGQTDLNGELVQVNTRAGAGGTTLVTDPYKVSRDQPTTRDGKQIALSGVLNWDLGGVDLTILTSYIDADLSRNNDDDFSENPAAVTTITDDYRTYSAELQLASSGENNFVDWVAGMFYYDDSSSYEFLFDRPFVLDGNVPSTTPSPTLDFGNDTLVDTRSIAVFGQATLNLTDQLRVRAGARYTRDKKDVSIVSLSGATAGTVTASGSETFSRVTYLVGADYQLAPDNMVYATVSTGFNAGGFNSNGTSFDEQTVTAYEVGSKNRFLDGMLQVNLSAYYNDLKDLLSQTFVPVGPTILAISTNAGAAKARGVELELSAAPTDELRIGGFIAYTDAKFGDFILPNPFALGGTPGLPANAVQLDGQPVPLHPKWALGATLSYDIDGGQFGRFTPFIQTAYKDSHSTADLNFPSSRQSSYTKTDARLLWESATANWGAEIYVENLEDKTVLTRSTVGGQVAIFQNFAPPRTFGFKLRYRFN